MENLPLPAEAPGRRHPSFLESPGPEDGAVFEATRTPGGGFILGDPGRPPPPPATDEVGEKFLAAAVAEGERLHAKAITAGGAEAALRAAIPAMVSGAPSEGAADAARVKLTAIAERAAQAEAAEKESRRALADALRLEDDLSAYADLAFHHPDLADTYFAEGVAAIKAAGAEASQTADRRAAFRRQVYGGAIQGLMANDPAATLARLKSGAFDGRLDDPATRANLTAVATAKAREQAAEAELKETEAAAREAAAEGLAVLDLTARVEAGAALEGDVETAFRAGAIAAAQRDEFMALVDSRRQARAARTDSVTFVARALKGGDALDPENPAHRSAVDVFHEDEIAAEGGAPDALVAATGIVPTAVGRSIHVGLLNADPGNRAAVLRRFAALLEEGTIGKENERQTDGKGAER